MNRAVIGILFIIAGLAYGSLVFDVVYNKTLGFLVENEWINPPKQEQGEKSLRGRKTTIILYSLILIIIGIYILWSPQF